MKWLPADLGRLPDGLRRELGPCDIDKYVGIKRLHLDDVRVDSRLGDLIGVLGNDHRLGLVAEPFLQTFEIILPVIVVLVDDGDPGVRLLPQNIFCVNSRLALIAGLKAHGPGEVLWIIPLARTAGDEQLRYLLGVHVPLNGSIVGRAKRIENQENFVALDQFARLLDCLWRTVGVVIGNESNLATVDTAFGVDLAEVGRLGLANNTPGRCRSTVRHDVADFNLGVSCAGIIFLLRKCAASADNKQNDGGRKRRQSSRDEGHSFLPINETMNVSVVIQDLFRVTCSNSEHPLSDIVDPKGHRLEGAHASRTISYF